MEVSWVLLVFSRWGDGGHFPHLSYHFFCTRTHNRREKRLLQGPLGYRLNSIRNSRMVVSLCSFKVITSAWQCRVSSVERDTICHCFRGRVMWGALNLQQMSKNSLPSLVNKKCPSMARLAIYHQRWVSARSVPGRPTSAFPSTRSCAVGAAPLLP